MQVFSNIPDRVETLKYLEDLHEHPRFDGDTMLNKTPFMVLKDNYIEQLKATLNYSPTLKVREFNTETQSELYLMIYAHIAVPTHYEILLHSEKVDNISVNNGVVCYTEGGTLWVDISDAFRYASIIIYPSFDGITPIKDAPLMDKRNYFKTSYLYEVPLSIFPNHSIEFIIGE